MYKNHRNFKFFDGDTGQAYHVKEFIDDGKPEIIEDTQETLDIIALMRWSDDGGIHPQKRWSY